MHLDLMKSSSEVEQRNCPREQNGLVRHKKILTQIPCAASNALYPTPDLAKAAIWSRM